MKLKGKWIRMKCEYELIWNCDNKQNIQTDFVGHWFPDIEKQIKNAGWKKYKGKDICSECLNKIIKGDKK